MKLQQNDLERLKDAMGKGEMTADQANVEMVRMKRVELVTSPIPANVRRALNAAVKRGELGHVKKDGDKPEAYYETRSGWGASTVEGERARYAEEKRRAISAARNAIMIRPFEDPFEGMD